MIRRDKKKAPTLIPDCKNGKPIEVVLNSTHQPEESYLGLFGGIVKEPLKAGQRYAKEYFVVEYSNRKIHIEMNSSLRYNSQFVRFGDTIKVIFEGFNQKYSCYSFAVLKQLQDGSFVVAANGKKVTGDWDVSKKRSFQ
jgi:hypothetical protein